MSGAIGWRGGQFLVDGRCAVSAEVSRTAQCVHLAMQRNDSVDFASSGRLYVLHLSLAPSLTYKARNCIYQCSSSTRAVSVQAQCNSYAADDVASDGVGHGRQREFRSRGLFRVAALIGSATVISKILGLVRETVLAAGFGVGPVIDAFSYSMIIPGFFLTLLGGINGPLHSTTAVALSKRSDMEGRDLVQKLTKIISIVCGSLSIGIYVFAGVLVDAIAPGLRASDSANAFLTRKFAIVQLKIMAPSAILAGLTGIGYGVLSSVGVYGLPSLSPALSSVSIMVAVCIYALRKQQPGAPDLDGFTGAVYLAGGAAVGALFQWALQAIAQHTAGFKRRTTYERRELAFVDRGIEEVFSLLLPATFASGMLQIATYTDLYFASFIPGAAAALGYANLLSMAPMGILSSSILVPLLPMFSRLSEPSRQQELQERVRQGLLLAVVPTCLVTALSISLAGPIVRIVFERHEFGQAASTSVSSLLVLYALGATFYISRDFLVNVFYALGDGGFPFRVSCGMILSNFFLDWVLVRYAGLGARGLVLATSIVSCGAVVSLMFKLSTKLEGFNLQYWIRPLLLLGCSGTVAGMSTKYAHDRLSSRFFPSITIANNRNRWAIDVALVMSASAVGLVTFTVPLFRFFSDEIKSIRHLLQAEL